MIYWLIYLNNFFLPSSSFLSLFFFFFFPFFCSRSHCVIIYIDKYLANVLAVILVILADWTFCIKQKLLSTLTLLSWNLYLCTEGTLLYYVCVYLRNIVPCTKLLWNLVGYYETCWLWLTVLKTLTNCDLIQFTYKNLHFKLSVKVFSYFAIFNVCLFITILGFNGSNLYKAIVKLSMNVTWFRLPIKIFI